MEKFICDTGSEYHYLPNAWLGVSAENQECADERIPILLDTPAAVRFVSLEPLLGPIDLDYFLYGTAPNTASHFIDGKLHCGGVGGQMMCSRPLNALHWVIVGGESGPGARPMNPEWVRSIRDQCKDAGVPFFFKQWGEWITPDQYQFSAGAPDLGSCKRQVVDGVEYYRVGKKYAGRLLDGVEHNGRPGK